MNTGIFKSKKFYLLAGLLLSIGGGLLLVFDWSMGEEGLHVGFYYFPSIIMLGYGAYLLINLKLKNKEISGLYAILVIVIFGLTLNLFENYYMRPKILNEGKEVTAIVIRVYNKSFGESGTKRAIYYKYEINGLEYIKTDYSENLRVGESILIKYLESNPNYHLRISNN